MAEIILVTGGARSGKSAYAQARAEKMQPERVFIATCPVVDTEMAERIRRHQKARSESGWRTVEETTALSRVLGQCRDCGVVLIDCLTLWVNNLLFSPDEEHRLDEDRMARLGRELVESALALSCPVIMVTNEVGLGIVPENGLARRYRDLVGRLNQTIGAAAAEVILVVAGQSLTIKKYDLYQKKRR